MICTELRAGQGLDDSSRVEYALRLLRRAASKISPIVVVALALSGCGNPYALKIGKIDYEQKQAPGVIQFTDPKIYKREALINERRNEHAYLKELLDKSKEEKFEAQIVREVELIQSFAGSVGLKFDAGANLEFQRVRELGDMQHRIQLTRLEMQLAQLERDAKLLSDKLATQDEPSGSAPDGAVTTADLPSEPNAPDLGNLLAQVKSLRTFVSGRLDAKSHPPRESAGKSSPIDRFHDREAYRDAIKAAINAQSLDELHDMNGSSLFRVQLQATVFPSPGNHVDTLGLLRMEVMSPGITKENGELPKLYQRWLWHVTQRLNRPPPDVKTNGHARFEQDQLLLGLGESGGLFNVIMLEVAKRPDDSADACRGWREEERDTANCWYLRIPVSPDVVDDASKLYDMVSQFSETQRNTLNQQTQKLISKAKEEETSLSPLQFMPLENNQNVCSEPDDGTGDLKFARDVQDLWPALDQSLLYFADTDLGNSVLEAQLRREVMKVISRGDKLRVAASRLIQTIASVSVVECRKQIVAPWLADVPAAFAETIKSVLKEPGQPGNRVSIYDVSPTERVHRVSTAARAADAIAMAASLAGMLPSAGFAGSGNFAYTRSAVGKADALERAPLVVGFAEPGVRSVTWVEADQDGDSKCDTTNHACPRFPSFGWLLGPKVSLDPEKKALVLEHYLAPHELQVDLSMPGWWPYFDLKVYSAWAPNWRNGAAAAKSFAPAEPRLERTVRIPMRHNAADLQGLTRVLLEDTTGRPVEQPRISEVHPRALTVCSGSFTFAIEGDGIWRASEVHIGGHRVPETGIRVLPDMTGVAVTVDSNDLSTLSTLGTEVVVWTHNGKASRDVKFIFTSDAKACADKQPAPPKDKPAITRVLPSSISACDSSLAFTVEGRNLWSNGSTTTASLGTMRASVQPQRPRDGTVVEVRAHVSDRVREIGGLDKLSVILRTKHGVAQGEVTVTSSKACDVVSPAKLQPAPVPPGPAISTVLPSTFSSCDDEPRFSVLGRHLDGLDRVMFGTIPATILTNPPPSADSFEITVTHPNLTTKLIGLETIDLVARTARGIANGKVNLKRGDCP